MKSLIINDTLLYYDIIDYQYQFYSDRVGEETNFYLQKSKKRKKYFLFGKDVEYVYYEKIFSLSYSIENCKLSKEFSRNRILRELNNYIARKRRCEEIKRNEII